MVTRWHCSSQRAYAVPMGQETACNGRHDDPEETRHGAGVVARSAAEMEIEAVVTMATDRSDMYSCMACVMKESAPAPAQRAH